LTDEQSLDVVDNAIDAIRFLVVGKDDVDLRNCYGVAVSSPSHAENSITIKIVNQLIDPAALPCFRATILHELCHGLRFFVYERDFATPQPPPSPEKYRPAAKICEAYSVPDGEGELGLLFQQEMFGGTVAFRDGRCWIVESFSGTYPRKCRTFTDDELLLLDCPVPQDSIQTRTRSGASRQRLDLSHQDTRLPLNCFGESLGKCGNLRKRASNVGEAESAWSFLDRSVPISRSPKRTAISNNSSTSASGEKKLRTATYTTRV
jgi:hypothetical protein